MKKKQFYVSTLLSLALIPTVVNAESLHDLNQKNQQVQENLDKAKANKNQTQLELNNIVNEISQLDEQLKKLNEEMLLTQNQIQERETQISKIETHIYYLKVQIEEKEKELNDREEEIAETLRVMYSRGDVSVLEFLFRSENVSQFINRYETLKKVKASHQEIYDQVKITLESIEKDKNELEAEEDRIEKEKIKLIDDNKMLEVKQQQVAGIKHEMQQKEAQANEQLKMEQDVINQLIQENQELEMQMEQEKQRIENEKNNVFVPDSGPVITGNDVIDIAYKWVQNRGEGSSNPVHYSMPRRQLNLTTYGDCSSFTRRVFLDAGKGDIGFTTAQQVTSSKGYFSDNINELVPGDLMYFGPTGSHQYAITLPNGKRSAVSHVAIYVGNGKMIDLSSSVGTISVKSFAPGAKWEKYVNTRFIGLKRF